MSPTRIHLSGSSLDELREQVRVEHGPAARIVAARRVTVGGIAGFFARKHYEVTVEVPVPSRDAPVARVTITQATPRAGIAALLADADAAEDALHGGAGASSVSSGAAVAAAPAASSRGSRVAAPAPAPGTRRAARLAAGPAAVGPAPVSTESDAFASIMDDLVFNGIAPAESPEPVSTPAPEARAGSATAVTDLGWPGRASSALPSLPGELPVPPAVLTGAGDLVVVVGRPGDAFRVAAAMSSSHGLRSVDVDDRRSGILARATGVHEGAAVITALAWDDRAAAVLQAVGADQVWVAVDAGRKHDDTARWVDAVRAVVPVAAAAVVGEDDTATPGTVHLLGIPVGWQG
ncbi:hypothetical protein ACPEEZ_01935 [Frigoribacterium sp. 2-23]|uniref:hypothetical protein n=1 Tax=Frigoribacterium sp. 2-23 TaxID=3415006 RepID=UPI003C6FB480